MTLEKILNQAINEIKLSKQVTLTINHILYYAQGEINDEGNNLTGEEQEKLWIELIKIQNIVSHNNHN